MPPAACPNDGICLTIGPRLIAVEEKVEILQKCAGKIDRMETVMSERDKISSKMWNAMLAVLGLSIVHFAAFLIWMGGTTERLTAFKESDARQNEAIIRIEQQRRP